MSNWIWQRAGWPKFKWNKEKLSGPLASVRKKQGILLGRLSGIGMDMAQRAQGEVLIEEVMGTSAIEAQPLDRNIVRSSVARRLGIPTGGVSEKVDRNVDGLVDVLIDSTRNFQKALNSKRLYDWHAGLFPTGRSGIRKIRTAGWRNSDEPMQVVSGFIGAELVHYEAPPSAHIQQEMRLFFEWWRKTVPPSELDGLLRAGIAHFWFVSIHPFEDGNGRLARAVADMALAQDDNQPMRFYSMSSQILMERVVYYDFLEHCQRGSLDLTEWLLWFLGCFERALDRSEGLMAGVLYRVRFWNKHMHTEMSARQRKIIDRLLEALPNAFEGGLTTRKYVSIGKTSRATAFREIQDLVEKGILREKKGPRGRSTSYELIIPDD